MGASQIQIIFLIAIFLPVREAKIVDMTHHLNKSSHHYVLFRDFELTVALNRSLGNIWGFANDIAMSEHTGTHIDAPGHTYLSGKLVDAIPLKDLMGPARVLDVIEKAKNNTNYAVTIDDIKDHEIKYGQIEEGSIILLRTGGEEVHWNTTEYRGTQTPNDPASMNFPGFGAPAVEWLIKQRKIKGIGEDRMSFDVGETVQYPVHKVISENGIWGLENVNRVKELPPKGATVFVMPILIEKGSGGPVRIVAFTEPGNDLPFMFGGQSRIASCASLFVATVCLFYYFLPRI